MDKTQQQKPPKPKPQVVVLPNGIKLSTTNTELIAQFTKAAKKRQAERLKLLLDKTQ